MSQFNIKDIERLTGIKAHTLRIWEQRYNFLVPHRTETNIRYYDDSQLKRLLNISVLVKNGIKISTVSKMTNDQIAREVKKIVESTNDKDTFFDFQIDSLVVAMIELDEDRFEKIISSTALRYGFEETMLKVLIPFLYKVGVMWSIGEINVGQEHFITNLIRKKIIVAIDGQMSKRDETASKYMLFLPEGEYHELGLLFAKYLLKSRGKNVIYLGQTVPFDDLVKLSERYKPDYYLTYFTTAMDDVKIKEYIYKLSEQFKGHRVLVCGPHHGLSTMRHPDNVFHLETIEDMIHLIENEH